VAPEDFVAEEAALLDAGRLDDWLALFEPDGRYWVPLLGARQADPFSHNSLAWEDRLLLQLRVDRLKDPRAHSQHPRSSCQHVLQRPVLVAEPAADQAGAAGAGSSDRSKESGGDGGSGNDGGSAVVWLRTPFIYVEARGGEQLVLAGSYRHGLVRRGDSWCIRLKRVDLLDPARALPAVQLFI
jgi:hypothetical protein